VIEEFASEQAHTVRDTVVLLLSRLSKALGLHSNSTDSDSGVETEPEDEDEDDYFAFSDDDEVYNAGSFNTFPTDQCDMTLLQRLALLLISAIIMKFLIEYLQPLPRDCGCGISPRVYQACY
jgi:ubiquitin-conjugating enzyme E2 Q